jgi:hypothetical protein
MHIAQPAFTQMKYVSIIPVSDPNAATMSQRVVQYQAVIQLAQMAPQIYDQPELHRQMLRVLGIKNIEKLIPSQDDVKLVDPVQENQNILLCKPVKAQAWQDHESHIRAHQAAMQDPLIQQLMGQNPKANMIMAAMTAHIAEHVGFAYRNRISQAMGLPLPSMGKDDSLSEQAELQLSRLIAQAAPQVLQQSQQIVAQMQAQQNAQDPVLVAQRMEQENNRMEIERKKARDDADIKLEQEKLRIEAQSKGVDPIQVQADIALEHAQAADEMELKKQQAQHKQEMDAQRLRHQQEIDGIKTGAQLAQQREQGQFEKTRRQHEQAAQASRTSLELTAKHQQMAQAAEKHKQDMKLKEEQHKAALEAKRKAAQQQKAKPKGE